MIGYDNLAHNHQILLDLPFREAAGTITHDEAKPHHQDVALVNAPTWESLVSGLGVLDFDGVNQHLALPFADCVDLDFTIGDYSLGCWFYVEPGLSQMLMCRFQLDVSGWELYHFTNLILSLRHSHAGGVATRTSCYSTGWANNTWHFMGISRTGGGQAVHYRNGVPLVTTSALEDPETGNQNLYIAAGAGGAQNFVEGKLWRPRAWNRVVTEPEWAQIFAYERHWFGV